MVRGALTEGRYLVIESNGYAITNPGIIDNQLTTSAATSDHSNIHQRWIIHTPHNDGEPFNITSAVAGNISQHISLATDVSGVEVYVIQYQGSGQ